MRTAPFRHNTTNHLFRECFVVLSGSVGVNQLKCSIVERMRRGKMSPPMNISIPVGRSNCGPTNVKCLYRTRTLGSRRSAGISDVVCGYTIKSLQITTGSHYRKSEMSNKRTLRAAFHLVDGVLR